MLHCFLIASQNVSDNMIRKYHNNNYFAKLPKYSWIYEHSKKWIHFFNNFVIHTFAYYTVSHFSYAPFFQGPHFLTKMLESNILYDNLFNDILSVWWHRKKYWKHSCESFCYVKGNFDKNAKMHVQAERPYFLFLFCASHYPWWSLWQKNTKNNYFIQVKPPFLIVEFSNTVTFWRNVRFDVILTSVTIIKQGFLRKLFCFESFVDIEVSKH